MIEYVIRSCILLIIFSWNVHSNMYDWNHIFKVRNVICETKECYDYETYLDQNMDTKADPCTDFYEYVCGKREQQNPLAPIYPEWSTHIEMAMKSMRKVQVFLEEKPKNSDDPYVIKAKKLYEECMNQPFVGVLNNSMIRSYIKEAGYFPLFPHMNPPTQKGHWWTNIHNYYLGLTGETGIFRTFVIADHLNQFEPLLYVTKTVSSFGRIGFNEPLDINQQTAYQQFLLTLLPDIFPIDFNFETLEVLKKRLANVIAFRQELQILLRGTFDVHRDYNIMSVTELNTWYQSMFMNKNKPGVKIPWIESIKALYGGKKTEDQIKYMDINIADKTFHKAVAHLLYKTPNNVIVDHMHLYFIERHVDMSPFLKTLLIKMIVIGAKLIGYIRYLTDKPGSCITTNSMMEATGKYYVEKFFPASNKKEAEDLVVDIRTTLKLQIINSKLLNDFAKMRLQKIINDMQVTVGYPDFYEDESLRPEYAKIPPTLLQPERVEAYYCARANRVGITAGFFELPMYSPKLSRAVVYGSMGSLIGHEMFHAFSPTVAKKCHLKDSPMLQKMLYAKKKKCFVKQYNKIPIEELNYIKPVPLIDGQKTLDENIADSMGLKVSYESFRRNSWENGRCLVLPNKQDIDCVRLFFIAFATGFCTISEPDKLLEDYFKDNHSTPRIRVNVAAANMEVFSRAFNCPKGSPMNPEKRCDLWK